MTLFDLAMIAFTAPLVGVLAYGTYTFHQQERLRVKQPAKSR